MRYVILGLAIMVIVLLALVYVSLPLEPIILR